MKQQSLMSFFSTSQASNKKSNEEKKETSCVENKPKVTTKKVDVDEIEVLNKDDSVAANNNSVLKESNNNKRDSPSVAKKSSKSVKSSKSKKLESDDDAIVIDKSISDEESPVKKNEKKSKRRKLKIDSDSSSSDEVVTKVSSKHEKMEIDVEEVKTKEEEIEVIESKTVKVASIFSKVPASTNKASPVKKDVKSPETKKKKNKSPEKKRDKSPDVIAVCETSSNEFAPNKESYHPINNACWKKGESVPYMALAKTFNCMEQTKKRLELISILCNYFRSVILISPNDLVASVYLCLNKVAPDYEGIELGIGDTILFKALAQATGRTLDKIKLEFQEKGDIGLVAESNRCNQKLLFTPKKLTIQVVFAKLKEIASLSGNSSQQKKGDFIKSLLVSCDSIEAKFLLRSLSGKLRIGLAEQSALSALSNAISMSLSTTSEQQIINYYKEKKIEADEAKKMMEENAKLLKQTYYQCPNYEIIIAAVLKHGLEKLPENCKLTPGIPLKPMLAYPTNGIQEILKRFEDIDFTCEYKYDGERAQIHILPNGDYRIYSRNSENNTSKYPDVINMVKEILSETGKDEDLKVKTAIVDAEVVAYDVQNKVILPFQVLSTRKRKDASESEIKIQVCLFAFDLIYLNEKSLINEPLRKRRELLIKHFPFTENKLMHAVSMNSNDVDQIQEFLDKSVKDGCEGLMIKTLDTDAHYEISKRSHNWLKLKKDYVDGVGDTLDLVVIGGYLGTGKRTGVYGGYLLACYDEENEEYQTICKIGTGFKDEDLEKQCESLGKIRIDSAKSYYRVDDSLKPDHWFEAEQVWEVKCADFSLSPIHTAAQGLVDSKKGISLRFPRFLRLRTDKKPEDSTSSTQISNMYKNQQQMVNQTNKKKDADEDEEDF